MLVGSAAAFFHGYSRQTEDFDFVVDLQMGGVPAFVAAFSEGFYCDPPQIEDAIAHQFMFNVISHTYWVKADCVIMPDEPFQHSAMSRRVAVDWHGTPLWVTSGQDLVISKLLWSRSGGGSHKQRADVRMILSSGKVELDDYFERWLQVFDLAGELEASREARYDE